MTTEIADAVNFKVTLLAIIPWRVQRLAQGQQQPVHCFSCGGQSGDLTEEEDQAKEHEQTNGEGVSDPSMYSEIEEDKGQVSTFPLKENSAYQANIQVKENEAYTTHTNR